MEATKLGEISTSRDMDNNEVRQNENTVGGDQAGRDVNKGTTYAFSAPNGTSQAMRSLIEKFKQQRESDPKLNAFIAELDYYHKRVDGDVQGLESKLEDAAKSNLFINYALGAKEQFHKKLMRYQFSESAQQINVFLLALVHSYFIHNIHAKICAGVAPETVHALMIEQLVNPLLQQLDENVLGFTARDIEGMVYFLTGNCHITWTN